MPVGIGVFEYGKCIKMRKKEFFDILKNVILRNGKIQQTVMNIELRAGIGFQNTSTIK